MNVVTDTPTVRDQLAMREAAKLASVYADLKDALAVPYTGGYGRMQGFADPNPDVGPSDLFGSMPRRLGYLYKVRYAHHVAAQVMDDRRAAIGSLTFRLKPARPTNEARVAAASVTDMFNRLPGYSLAQFVADVYDYRDSFGHAVFEVVRVAPGVLMPLYVPAFMLKEFFPSSSGLEIDGVQFDNGMTTDVLPASKLCWYGRPAFPGNFWGIAATRKIQSLVAAYEQDLMMYLQQQRMARGVLYGKETEFGSSKASWDNMRAYLRAVFTGIDAPAVLDAGMDLKALQVQNPHLGRAKEMFEYYDTAIRGVLGRHLLNLGQAGVGARALGETVNAEQEKIWRNHVRELLRVVNGDMHPQSNFLQIVTRELGFDAADTPRVVVVPDRREASAQDSQTLALFAQSGWVTPEDLSEAGKAKLIRSLGAEPKFPLPEEVIEG